MAGERILIIEDEELVVQVYEKVLQQAGYQTRAVRDGMQALVDARNWQPDLILLDLILPGLHGLEICHALRGMPGLHAIPLLMVTANAHIADRVTGLEAGADDYLTKPFNIDELAARVRALLRRVAQYKVDPIADSGVITLNPHTLQAQVGERSITLTRMEHQLLSYLIRNEGVTCSTEQLLRDVWGYPIDAAELGLVRWHMTKLRHKIERDPKHPRYIRNIRSRGYIYKPASTIE